MSKPRNDVDDNDDDLTKIINPTNSNTHPPPIIINYLSNWKWRNAGIRYQTCQMTKTILSRSTKFLIITKPQTNSRRRNLLSGVKLSLVLATVQALPRESSNTSSNSASKIYPCKLILNRKKREPMSWKCLWKTSQPIWKTSLTLALS